MDSERPAVNSLETKGLSASKRIKRGVLSPPSGNPPPCVIPNASFNGVRRHTADPRREIQRALAPDREGRPNLSPRAGRGEQIRVMLCHFLC